MAIMFVWYLYTTAVSLYQHCGYEIPYLFFIFPPVTKHDFHHEKPSNQMYSKYGLMDYLFGTDQLWWQQHQRATKLIVNSNQNSTHQHAIIKRE